MKPDLFLFISFFLEALKPNATALFDSAIDIADAAVSASTRVQVRATESADWIETPKVSIR